MTIEQQQHDENEKRPPQSLVEKSAFAGESRRRFTKTGIAASGVLVTLASRSVLGCEINTSPSGFVSANQSTHGPQQLSQGRSPGYWKNHKHWPINNTTLFSSIFGCAPKSPYKDVTMMQLLSHQDFDKDNLGMHLVAAYLNALMGWTPFLSPSAVVNIFTEWQLNGYFNPVANVNWNGAQIVTYISGTQS
ncbi:MAG: hypothetical protein V4634_07695 [Pseudomonadota bacterium]